MTANSTTPSVPSDSIDQVYVEWWAITSLALEGRRLAAGLDLEAVGTSIRMSVPQREGDRLTVIGRSACSQSRVAAGEASSSAPSAREVTSSSRRLQYSGSCHCRLPSSTLEVSPPQRLVGRVGSRNA
jgi:hypothetical protein